MTNDSYQKTSLWKRTLGKKKRDQYEDDRERLRQGYKNLRERIVPIAQMIAKDLPYFTVHDVTHYEALWEYADLIAGPDYPVNPCEAFVLGCSFLIHDLGMTLSAYPDGVDGLKALPEWRDAVAGLLRQKGVAEINDEAIDSVDVDLQEHAMAEVLRRRHAEQAERLVATHWDIPTKGQQFYLIDNQELRESFGVIIGRLAYSHWWSIERLEHEFRTVVGSAAAFPPDWTIDLLKLGAILRVTDYAHIDERRAPSFIWAFRKPVGLSDIHWQYQNKLKRPYIQSDRLVYTAKSDFNVEEASAWWMCFDTLRAIDSELKNVDALLADNGKARLRARAVSQIEEPSRLTSLIKTVGWKPVDATIRVSAVADLVRSLGGKALYGDQTLPPLRELVQNAADAIRARRLIDNRHSEWGEIRVTTGHDASGSWCQVEDNGIGMSERVLSGPFLDFGSSFWGSQLMHEELPGLDGKGFQAIGRYGIGFFSVFMWGDSVDVFTRRYDKAIADTLVLSFKRGLKERPLLRIANSSECLAEGGTKVKVRITDEATNDALGLPSHIKGRLSLVETCTYIAPCMDVTIKVTEMNGPTETAITANDWLKVNDAELIRRIRLNTHGHLNYRSAPPRLQLIEGCSGRCFGRAAICPSSESAIVTVGGLRACSLDGIVGVLVGSPTRAARDVAIPSIPFPMLQSWATSEAKRSSKETLARKEEDHMARIVNRLGGEPVGLAIAKSNKGWLSPEQLMEHATTTNEVVLTWDAPIMGKQEAVVWRVDTEPEVKLNEGIFATATDATIYISARVGVLGWPGNYKRFSDQSLKSAVIRALAKGWGCSIDDVLAASDLSFHNSAVVGEANGAPFKGPVAYIRRPAPS
jgi:hypothetical protein